MSFNPRRLRSANELRALSHPLRLDILEQLTLHGAMTASDLGDILDETPANCSWHLRKLAEHGFVEETERDGRRRPWRVTRVGLSWDHDEDVSASPGYQAASRALTAQFIDREVVRWGRNTEAAERNWAHLGASETVALLTEEEAVAFSAELKELLMRHHGRLTGEEPVPDGARAIRVLAMTSVDPQ
ncbi:MAG: helix-turn-helix domain-containing protein [Intrasporangium sp.]|uniref:ArsR/SmtB family transcription factor n=1 Tax=Intrasporangium sp. TaxID=1925024 RepID=UPI00264741D4|nr:metalloregulator ArsR/SmtB family transcription factor [Intrasporangium sp.]MDN5795411.1 helix-turn-helix domain-containing protein [Intrasporangium sp.]